MYGVTTVFVGAYEWMSSGNTLYYGVYPERKRRVGSTRVVQRVDSSTLYWLLGDHLGSTSRMANGTAAPTA